MEEDANLEILSAWVGQAAEPVAIGGGDRGGGLDLDTPRLAAAGDDEVDAS